MDLFSDNPTIFTVSELRETLNNIITEAFSGPILLRGVISSKPKLYPQFVFFDIRDETKNQFFTVFALKHNFLRAEAKLKDLGIVDKITEDIPIMLIAKVKVSTQKQISLRIIMEDIVPDYTKSILKNQKDITLEKLQKEGLLDRQKQLSLPKLIRKILIISSDQGTSLRDIKSSIAGAIKFIDIVFASSRVEGSTAIPKLIEAVKMAEKVAPDLIILARGGGSTVDLSIFNDYDLCKTVALCSIPIVSAIGHDKDELAVEFVSFKRPQPATPSGAGAYVKDLVLDNFLEFKEIFSTVANLLHTNFDMNTLRVKELVSSILSIVRVRMLTDSEKIKNLLNTVKDNISTRFIQEEKYLKLLIETVSAYNHKNVLKRGYAVVWHNGTAVKKLADAKQNMEIEFVDGTISVKRV